MTAKEYLEQVRHKQAEIGNLKRDKEAVKDIFELLDLPLDILYRKSYELSGGQEVRVMLALILWKTVK